MVTLVIMDGFGIRREKFGNAIAVAGTPNLDKLRKQYAFTTLSASGKAVGLPEGQMGNSEVGHLTIGSGRVVLQDLSRINADIKSGKFFENESLNRAMLHAEKNNSNLHIMGLCSNGGVHSHINHLFAILEYAKNFKIQNIYIHFIADGRDTGATDGRKFIESIQEYIEGTNIKIATICGRIYAMDREKRWDRIQLYYNLITRGVGKKEENPLDAISQAYNEGLSDEFLKPIIIDEQGTIKEGDSLIFFNYRSDRAREITQTLTDKNFKEFDTIKYNNLLFSPMQEYAKEFANLNTIYHDVKIEDNLSAMLSKAGLKQYHISETTKYAHVTFFFNGGIEKPYEGETRKLIESYNDKDFSAHPLMRANEISLELLDAIASNSYDFLLVNFSNPDMIGHTGNFEATKQAIECVDKQAYAVALATLLAGGTCVITADHGNAELMFDHDGNKITSHTTSPVPFFVVSKYGKKIKLRRGGTLANIATTILDLVNLEHENLNLHNNNMEKSLIKKLPKVK